ncbi:hypothetical protein ACIODS_11900 [Micromonospora chalcea]|uniref:hypothetical protein n=1 Tax=Micromonospora chalcea TaxID=1874 RepID=UPI0038130343
MRYFIAYSYNNGRGIGSCVYQPHQPITSGDDLYAVCQQIASKNGFDNVVITSLTPLPTGTDGGRL